MKKIFEIFEIFEVGEYYESNSLIVSRCPVHDGDNLCAFNINVDEENLEHYGRWFCNTKNCHDNKPGKDILSLVWMLLEKKLGKSIGFSEVLRFCKKLCKDVQVNDVNIYISSDPIDKILKFESKIKTNNKNNRINRETVRKRLIFPAQFYIDRGFSPEALDLFDVGVCKNTQSQMYNRVVFPVYDETDTYMIGCTGRTICNSPKKWINQKGFNKSNFLYNYGKAMEQIKATQTIILVEGQGDVIRLWESGIRNAVGIFGSKISDSQEFLIQKTGASNIVIMTDNDDAGQSCAKDLQERLQYLFNICLIKMPKNDVGDMTIEEINEIIKPQIEGKF